MATLIGQICIMLSTEQLSLQASFPKHVGRKTGGKTNKIQPKKNQNASQKATHQKANIMVF